jgi:hypothetical protein
MERRKQPIPGNPGVFTLGQAARMLCDLSSAMIERGVPVSIIEYIFKNTGVVQALCNRITTLRNMHADEERIEGFLRSTFPRRPVDNDGHNIVTEYEGICKDLRSGAFNFADKTPDQFKANLSQQDLAMISMQFILQKGRK